MEIMCFVCGFAVGMGVAAWGLNIVREIECEKCTWNPSGHGRTD